MSVGVEDVGCVGEPAGVFLVRKSAVGSWTAGHASTETPDAPGLDPVICRNEAGDEVGGARWVGDLEVA